MPASRRDDNGLMDRMQMLVRLAQVSRRLPPFRGKTRLQRALWAAATRGAPRAAGVVAARIGGVQWELDLAEVIQSQIFWEGTYGRGVLTWLGRQVAAAPRDRSVFWDVGANIGAVSLGMAATWPGLAIECFEPSPRVHAKLARHAALNPTLAVRIHRLALSDRTGTSLFHESVERSNSGIGALYAAHNNDPKAVEVEVARGDDLVGAGRAAPPTLIKIDVEGFEIEVLGGLGEVLRQYRPVLCVESAGPRLAERGRPVDAIGRRLEELGYRIARIDEVTGAEVALRDGDWARNIDLAAHPL